MTDKTQLEQIVNLIDNISYVEDGVLDAAQQLRDLFVEQTCEAIEDKRKNTGYSQCSISAKNLIFDGIEKAIRDKFK